MGDGHLGKCKICTRADVRNRREKVVEKYRAYDRKRSKDPKRVAQIKASQQRHIGRHKARIKARAAIASGLIKKEPCEVCGDPRSDAHHDDYERPLEVQWLCRLHHMRIHHSKIAEDVYAA